MLQAVLVERCKLQAQVAKKEVPIYALVVAKNGPRMHEVQPNEMPPVVRDQSGKVVQEWDLIEKRGEVHGRAVPMEALMYALSSASLGRQLVDRTGLKRKYNFDLLWAPEDESEAQPKGVAPDAGLTGATRISIFAAVQEQLGLKLEATKDFVDALTIEHIERPTGN
ncbi:MAG: hypothetical protein JWM43_545 [Acidobacteriaceae bacterium]|nr:hypothetical protein [Acidobacteriaceae bacterium]